MKRELGLVALGMEWGRVLSCKALGLRCVDHPVLRTLPFTTIKEVFLVGKYKSFLTWAVSYVEIQRSLVSGGHLPAPSLWPEGLWQCGSSCRLPAALRAEAAVDAEQLPCPCDH